MIAAELVSCLMEKASLQSGKHAWAVFEVVAGGELGNDHFVTLLLNIIQYLS